MIKDWLLNLVKVPEGFENDPKGFLINQVGHMAIGVILMMGSTFLIGMDLTLPITVAWECWHLYRRAKLWDCLEDLLFFNAIPLGLGEAMLAVVVLVIGVLRRREEKRLCEGF